MADPQSLMRAWQSGEQPGISNLELGDRSIPTPSDGELLVRVEAAALNFSDLLMINDQYQIRPPRPFVPGQEVAGSVVRAASGTSHPIGARVASKVLWGGFADHAIVRDDMAIAIPDGLNAAHAAALPVVYPTAVVALTESTRLEPGETVLVHAAAGGVGMASVQVAKALGARVIATAGSEPKCQTAREAGADIAINYRDNDWVDSVRAATGGSGVDVVVDPVGGKIATESLKCLAWQGRHLIVGFSSGDIPALPANRLLLRRASAIGVYWSHDHDTEMMVGVTERLVGMINRGEVAPLIGGTFDLEDLPQALAALRERTSVGKLILDLTADSDA